MKISYNWLKKYIDTTLDVEAIAQALTDTGLEVEGIEKMEAIQGGLEGVVVGEVLQCEAHPDADKLKVTRVSIGSDEPLQIVCGAPNVATGQKVIVATVGCTLYPKPDEAFSIKKAKIRGVQSEGMLCAEDELGIGSSHAGILVLPENTPVGLAASSYFDLEPDFQLEIGLTPNRADAMGIIGVARDLRAFLAFHHNETNAIHWPAVPSIEGMATNQLSIAVAQKELVPSYYGICMRNVRVEASPEWMQKSLRAVGIKPINTLVDISNYVQRELGTPLHIFDAALAGDQIEVRLSKVGEKLQTLDAQNLSLTGSELVIANSSGPMCLAGILGGLESGVKESTTSILIESAVFDPVTIRKAARRHGFNTDASFRFERGVDPERSLYALQRCVDLIQTLTGASISSELFKHEIALAPKSQIQTSVARIQQLIGAPIQSEQIHQILSSLDFTCLNEDPEKLIWEAPRYRVDVHREADLMEEILRIYGFNQVPIPTKWNYTLPLQSGLNPERIQEITSEHLVSRGFSELLNNSLTKASYAETYESQSINSKQAVRILNPLSQDLEHMRQSLLFGILESIEHNQNRQHPDLAFFEFGKTYQQSEGNYHEERQLIIAQSGLVQSEHWSVASQASSFIELKRHLNALLTRFGILSKCEEVTLTNELFADGYSLQIGTKKLVDFGWVHHKLQSGFDLKNPVFAAVINWDLFLKQCAKVAIEFQELPKSFAVRRDLSLLIDQQTTYAQLKASAVKAERKLLKSIDLFDVYEGKNLPEGKKSYALCFYLQDQSRTLQEQEIEKAMQRIIDALQSNCGASLRN